MIPNSIWTDINWLHTTRVLLCVFKPVDIGKICRSKIENNCKILDERYSDDLVSEELHRDRGLILKYESMFSKTESGMGYTSHAS